MKQLVIALTIILTLSGCGLRDAASVSAGNAPEQAFYQPDAPLERGTAGAVRTYDMGSPITGIAALGDRLLVCTGGKNLSVLDGSSLEVLRQRELDSSISWGSSSFLVTPEQIGCYDESSNCYVILNHDLVSVSTTQFPVSLTSDPAVSSDFKTLFYVAEDGIHALDLSTGISRILRQDPADPLTLEGLLFDNEVLRYIRTDPSGNSQTCFIDTHDGSLYYTATYADSMIHWDNWYAAAPRLEHPLGIFQRIVVGNRAGELKLLHPKQGWDDVLCPGSALVITQTRNKIGLSLSCYELETGMLISEVTLPQHHEPFISGCVQGGLVWLWNQSDSKFYCWDLGKSPPRDPVSVLEEFRSVTESVQTALTDCSRHVQDLQQQYGVQISFAENANRTQGLDYKTVPDYRPEMYEKALNELEDALAKLPKGFARQVGARGKNGVLHIQLVDDYDPVVGVLPGTGLCEFTDSGVVLSISMCRNLESLFLRELGNAVITRIATTNDGLKAWSELNPRGFRYGAPVKHSVSYLAQGQNYFTDSVAMQSPRADQAQVFLFAMLADQQSVFDSSHMQAKLSLLCRLIRQTYDIPQGAVLPWEQYLEN